MKAQAQSLLLEGKESGVETLRGEIFASQPGRNLYRTNKRDLLIQEFTASAPSNGRKKGGLRDSTVLRNEISTYLFEYLRGFHVATHFLGARPGAEMLVKSADPIPLLVRIFNVAEDDWPSFGMPASAPGISRDGHYLLRRRPVPALVTNTVYALNLLKPDELKQINRLASKGTPCSWIANDRTAHPPETRRALQQPDHPDRSSPATIRFSTPHRRTEKGNGAHLPVDTDG